MEKLISEGTIVGTVLTESEERYVRHSQGHKSFSFCEQTLHKGLIDASCDWIEFDCVLFSM